MLLVSCAGQGLTSFASVYADVSSAVILTNYLLVAVDMLVLYATH